MAAPQAKLPWLKWWKGTTTDPKLQLVAFESGCPSLLVIGAWALLLEHCDDDGWIIVVPGREPQRDDASRLLQVAGKVMEAEAERIIQLLEDHCLIQWEACMGHQVVRWRSRQMLDPGARERMRRKRARDQALS